MTKEVMHINIKKNKPGCEDIPESRKDDIKLIRAQIKKERDEREMRLIEAKMAQPNYEIDYWVPFKNMKHVRRHYMMGEFNRVCINCDYDFE